MKLTMVNGFLAATGIAAIGCALLVPVAAPAHASAPSVVQDGEGGVLVVGTAGDVQQVENLIYVVHKRRVTEREASFLKKIDSNFPEQRITLSVYRFHPGGAMGANGAPAVLHYQRDITWDEMIVGSTQKVHDECIENKKWVDEAIRKAQGKQIPSPK
jgi:hypothetical protein